MNPSVDIYEIMILLLKILGTNYNYCLKNYWLLILSRIYSFLKCFQWEIFTAALKDTNSNPIFRIFNYGNPFENLI